MVDLIHENGFTKHLFNYTCWYLSLTKAFNIRFACVIPNFFFNMGLIITFAYFNFNKSFSVVLFVKCYFQNLKRLLLFLSKPRTLNTVVFNQYQGFLLCGWRDSNPHALRHQILSLARLPITPHPLVRLPRLGGAKKERKFRDYSGIKNSFWLFKYLGFYDSIEKLLMWNNPKVPGKTQWSDDGNRCRAGEKGDH